MKKVLNLFLADRRLLCVACGANSHVKKRHINALHFNAFFCAIILLLIITGCGNRAGKDPITLTMWHVYGSQTESPLNVMINEFNQTKGKERGIVVSVVSVTNSTAIDDVLIASAHNEPGAVPMPDLFTAYPRVAEEIGLDRLLDWGEYLSEEERSAYVDEFLAEGVLDGRLVMLPVAKSTELLFLNKTIFDRFSADTGASEEDLLHFDTLFDLCCRYYDWSGGAEMFQINDFYHYFLVNIAGLGGQFVRDGKLDCNSKEFEQVCLPMARAAIHGGLCTGDGYASDRWKTAEVISNIGSTAGMLYLRDYVTYRDNTTEEIETAVYPYPVFSGAAPVVIQRGTGLFAMKSDDERKNEAAAVFGKWITEDEHNLDFVIASGYLPVTENTFSTLFSDMSIVENEKFRTLYGAVNQMYNHYTFYPLPLYDSSGEIQSGFEETVKSVLSIAHRDYISRIEHGDDPETAMSELLDSSLSEIRDAVER